jgi:hypothetical protein
MATIGVYGYRQNEVDKLVYALADASPDVLGKKILSHVSQTPLEELAGKETLELADYVDSDVNANEALLDPLCNWSYIINLDSKTLEVHSASPFLNHKPEGRYVVSQEPPRYKGAVLVHEIPLELITPNSIDYHVKAIETADNRLYGISKFIEERERNNKLKPKVVDPYLRIGRLIIGKRN